MSALEERSRREIADELRRDALQDRSDALRYWAHNRWLWLLSGIGSAAGGAGAAISGLTGSATAAGVFGLVATLAGGVQTWFNPNEMRAVHRRKSAACRALAQHIDTDLAAGEPTAEQVHAWVDTLKSIRTE